MKWIKRESPFLTFQEREQEIFKDFHGARTLSEKYAVKELDTAYELIKKFLDKPIRIVGDYDVDGQTSTTIMILGLKALGAKDINYYVPKRFSDGYGISEKIIDVFLIGTPGLLITVDNGIAAIGAVQKAKALGWTILIMDHHLPVIQKGKIIFPEADIIINPHAKTGTANFEDYCAAGLCFKFFQQIHQQKGIPDNVFDKIKTFAAIGTVADSVKLIDKIGDSYSYDNWLIVKDGLNTILQNTGRTTGLYCLLRVLGLEYNINEVNIAFTLAPVLNAVSRLNDDGASKVVEFLLREDNNFSDLDKIALEFKETNERRKTLTNLVIPSIIEEIEAAGMQKDYPLVIKSDNRFLHPGIVGLVAGKICEAYNTPVILLAKGEDGLLHGSCRAPEMCDIKAIMDNVDIVNDKLAYGGHAQAAGITMPEEIFDEYRSNIQQKAGDKPDMLKLLRYDYEIVPEEFKSCLEIQDEKAPYGQGHKKPVYKVSFTTVKDKYNKTYSILGKDNNILKLHGKKVEAINFSGEGLKKFRELECPASMTLYGSLEGNTFNGVTTPQLNFVDME